MYSLIEKPMEIFDALEKSYSSSLNKGMHYILTFPGIWIDKKFNFMDRRPKRKSNETSS